MMFSGVEFFNNRRSMLMEMSMSVRDFYSRSTTLSS